MLKTTTLAASLMMSIAIAAPQHAIAQQSSQQASAQYVNTYVELLPGSNQSGEVALDRFVAYARSQPGIVSIELVREIGLDYRYALRQVWRSASAYTAFQNAQTTQAWTGYLTPYLVAPFDNRLGSFVD